MRKRYILPVFLSLYTTAGALFILFAWFAGLDDNISIRELILLGTAAVFVATGTIFFSRDQLNKTLFLAVFTAILSASAVNFEFPELMKLPIQLPAENKVKISEIEEGAEISMTWAYWFRPRTQKGDLFLTNPDTDISFSHLVKKGVWNSYDNGDGPILTSSEAGESIGLPNKA